jgi:hypothetical protein
MILRNLKDLELIVLWVYLLPLAYESFTLEVFLRRFIIFIFLLSPTTFSITHEIKTLV